MKPEYYKREICGHNGHVYYLPVDIGWRFCKDELPEEIDEHYLVLDDNGYKHYEVIFNGEDWYYEEEYRNTYHGGISTGYVGLNVVQWYKMEEPLKDE